MVSILIRYGKDSDMGSINFLLISTGFGSGLARRNRPRRKK
jgi:hypothetical protein